MRVMHVSMLIDTYKLLFLDALPMLYQNIVAACSSQHGPARDKNRLRIV